MFQGDREQLQHLGGGVETKPDLLSGVNPSPPNSGPTTPLSEEASEKNAPQLMRAVMCPCMTVPGPLTGSLSLALQVDQRQASVTSATLPLL